MFEKRLENFLETKHSKRKKKISYNIFIFQRHINYKFLNYVAENFINNFETFEKHGLLMFRLLRTFADHDCPLNCKEWPFVKIILENVNLHAMMVS